MFLLYFRMYYHGGHEQERKTRTKWGYPSVWGQPQGKPETIVSWSESLLRRPIYGPKATLNGWMELVFTKRTHQASTIYSVTIGFARNFTYGVFFSHLVSPIYVQFLMNARNSFRLRSSSISKVIWWNKRECVTVVETWDIIVGKRLIYSLRTHIELKILIYCLLVFMKTWGNFVL